jgi:O-antigen/teichoic acid export membrane protein
VFAVKAGSAQVAGYVNMRINVVIVSALLGARSLGLYTLAISTAELLWLLSQPMCWAAFGRIAAEPLHQAAAFTAKLTRHIVAQTVPLAVVGAIAAPAVIGAVYGQAFEPAGRTIQLLLPGIAIYAIEAPLGYFLMVKLGRPGLIVAIQLCSIALCATATVLLAPTLGIDGAAIATTVTYLGVVVVKLTIFARATGIGPTELLLVRPSEIASLAERFVRVARVTKALST